MSAKIRNVSFYLLLALFFSLTPSMTLHAAKPKILVCGYSGKHASERKLLEKNGFLVKVGCPKKVNPENWDGLVIPGSVKNITPALYGARKSKYTNKGDLQLDKNQLRITRQFIKAKKPILGICRGCQMINVAFGGTLIQHIGVSRGGAKSGRWKGYHKGYRKIKVAKESWLYSEFGGSVSVKHSHHQCPDKLGKGLHATQWDAESGLIEGVEHESLPIYGLQWHPDLMEGSIPKKTCKKFKNIIIANKSIEKTKRLLLSLF